MRLGIIELKYYLMICTQQSQNDYSNAVTNNIITENSLRIGYSSVYPTRDVQSNCCVLKSLLVILSVVMPATQYAFRFIF